MTRTFVPNVDSRGPKRDIRAEWRAVEAAA